MQYNEALVLQKDIAERRKRGDIEDTLLLLEHAPVITLGRNTGDANVWPRARLWTVWALNSLKVIVVAMRPFMVRAKSWLIQSSTCSPIEKIFVST